MHRNIPKETPETFNPGQYIADVSTTLVQGKEMRNSSVPYWNRCKPNHDPDDTFQYRADGNDARKELHFELSSLVNLEIAARA